MNVSKVSFKTKMLVAAVAMAVTGAASALDNTSTAGVGSELVFNIWDPTSGQEASFTLGLDLNMNTFSGNTTVNFGNIFANAGFQSFLGASSVNGANNLSALRWNVGAGYTEIFGEEKAAFTHGPVGDPLSIMNNQVTQASTAMANFYSAFGAGNSGGAVNPIDPKFAGDSVAWGETMGGGVFQGTAGNVGDSLGFYQFTNNYGPLFEGSDTDPATAVVYGGSFSLSQTGDLIYTASPVPVPAAVWLLGSAMVGLVGVARRRNSETA